MKSLLLFTIAIAGAAPLICMADQSNSVASSNVDTNQLDNFYVGGNLGEAGYRDATASNRPKYRNDLAQSNNVFANLRFGWRWDGIIGPEIGYAYFGKGRDLRSTGDTVHTNGMVYNVDSDYSVQPQALTAGLNGKYEFYRHWFITGRAGRYWSKTEVTYQPPGLSCNQACANTNSTDSNKSYGNGWYGGLGVGYDMTSHVSVGLNYDDYNVKYNAESVSYLASVNAKRNIGALSASLEYRY